MALKYLVLFVCCLQYCRSAETIGCDNPRYKCVKHDPQVVLLTDFNDMEVRCPENQKCNNMHTSCDACVEYSTNCDGKFTCGDNSTIFHTEVGSFECGKNKVCNVDFKQPCDPCVDRVCREPADWKCYSSDVVICKNMYFQCAKGFFCNKDNKAPCKACIDQNGNEGTFVTYKM